MVWLSAVQQAQQMTDVGLHPSVLFTFGVGRMLAQHLLDRRCGVLVGRQLILHLHGVLGQLAYLPLTFPPQHFAHTAQQGGHDTVKEVMPTHI